MQVQESSSAVLQRASRRAGQADERQRRLGDELRIQGMATLRSDHQRLLEEILEKRGSCSTELLEKIRHDRLNGSELRDLCERLVDEFAASGLNKDDEPNERGLAIEDLIDLFNPFTRERENGN